MSELLCGIGFWLCLFAIPISNIIATKRSIRDVFKTIGRFVDFIIIFPFIAFVLGFAFSGTTGAVGSAIGAALWSTWFALTYALWKRPKKPQQTSNGKN